MVLCLDGCHEFILDHHGNHTGDSAGGEHAESCQSTRVFEDLGELREKTVRQSLN